MNNLLNKAVKLLSQRDYSEQELRQKLMSSLLSSSSGSSFRRYRASYHADSVPEYEGDEQASYCLSEAQRVKIQEVIDFCYHYEWLNDQRYAVRYVRSHSEKGEGQKKIEYGLLRKGIQKQLIAQAFDECQIDWVQLAYQVMQKRFCGAIDAADWHQKAKISRYLQSRGFSASEIHFILEKKCN